jgi:hypothetical protein
MASLCRIWREDFAAQISLAFFMRLYFVAGLFKNRRRGFPAAMAAAGARSKPACYLRSRRFHSYLIWVY